MITTEKMSVAALLSVNLRRKANRTIDVQWLLDNEEYAHEIIKFTRAQGFDDLTDYANNLEKLMFGEVSETPAAVVKPKPEIEKILARGADIDWAAESSATDSEEEVVTMTDKKNYVGHLR